MSLLLKRLNWTSVNKATRRQVGNREVYCPPISLYRWWARRPHALIGALLDASRLRAGDLVSDPFSGGGTVAVEAATRGLGIYAQDLNPWATWGLKTALDGVDADALEKGVDLFLRELKPAAVKEYGATCPVHGESETLHTFWVRECECQSCRKSIFLYPYSMLTVATRTEGEKTAFYGCSSCGVVSRRRLGHAAKCSQCGASFGHHREPLLSKRQVTCPHCHIQVAYSQAWSRAPRWRSVLVQRLCRKGTQELVHFDLPSPQEVQEIQRRRRVPKSLKEAIPRGRETAVLRRAGFRRWCELYPARQLRAMHHAAQVARRLDVPPDIRNRIQLAVAGAGEMAGFLCRWDRFHPKPFEALANHRFASLGLAVEVNPLSPRGRGTIRRRLLASIHAARWASEHIGNTRNSSAKGRKATVKVVAGSSVDQRLRTESVRLIVTDPPYYDAVQYGELANLFIRWAEVTRGRAVAARPNLREEAVPSRLVRDDAYERIVGKIFHETARTLRKDGRLLITFHSTDFRGWTALGTALHEAGLGVVAVGVARSENDKDHSKRGRRAFSKDLVIECRKLGVCRENLVVVTRARDSEDRELIAAGLAIAKHPRDGKEAMARVFLSLTRRMRIRRIEVPSLLYRAE